MLRRGRKRNAIQADKPESGQARVLLRTTVFRPLSGARMRTSKRTTLQLARPNTIRPALRFRLDRCIMVFQGTIGEIYGIRRLQIGSITQSGQRTQIWSDTRKHLNKSKSKFRPNCNKINSSAISVSHNSLYINTLQNYHPAELRKNLQFGRAIT